MAEDHVEFLKEYNEWMGQRKLLARDISPEAFLIDRAKDEALDRLIEIEQLIEAFSSTEWEEQDEYDQATHTLIRLINEVIKGED